MRNEKYKTSVVLTTICNERISKNFQKHLRYIWKILEFTRICCKHVEIARIMQNIPEHMTFKMNIHEYYVIIMEIKITCNWELLLMYKLKNFLGFCLYTRELWRLRRQYSNYVKKEERYSTIRRITLV